MQVVLWSAGQHTSTSFLVDYLQYLDICKTLPLGT